MDKLVFFAVAAMIFDGAWFAWYRLDPASFATSRWAGIVINLGAFATCMLVAGVPFVAARAIASEIEYRRRIK